jgi:hypothetical protein
MSSAAASLGPAITDSSAATSRTVRPIGPVTEACAMKPLAGTRPHDGRKPRTLLNAAGLRSEPM